MNKKHMNILLCLCSRDLVYKVFFPLFDLLVYTLCVRYLRRLGSEIIYNR